MTIPAVHTDIDATRQAVDVRNGNIALPRGGTLTFDGHAPLGGGASTPINALDARAERSDLANWSNGGCTRVDARAVGRRGHTKG